MQLIALQWTKLRWKQKVPTGCLSLSSLSVHSSPLIRLILIYCFNYTFLPWPLPARLIRNCGLVSEVERSKAIRICHTWFIRRGKSVPATKNPIKILSWICSYPVWKEKFVQGGSSDILTWSVFAELILVWTMTSSVLSEAHAFNAFTMADKPVEKSIPSHWQSMPSQVILKILMGVEIVKLNSHNRKLDFLVVV